MKNTNTNADQIKAQVCELLGWDEMDYAEYQFKIGIAYLMWYVPVDEELRRKLSYSRLFWNWFKHMWTVHDDSWLCYTHSLNTMHVQMRWALYEELHNPRVLAVEEKPNRVVLESIKNGQEVVA